jgi:hypothetical protein
MSRPIGSGEYKNLNRVRIVYQRGLLNSRGAQAELARILGVNRQYINELVRKVKAEGSALESK